jgi:hypothetical protein
MADKSMARILGIKVVTQFPQQVMSMAMVWMI